MTEGLLGGILGGEDENSEVEATETLASADAFAAAVVARLSASDPEVARDTSAFLQEQTQLLKVQKDHLKDEHALRLNRLSGQAREGKLRRVGIRIRIGFQVFLALAATVIGIIAAVAIRDAVTSKRVVIEPFDAPPALATRGLSGKVIAGGLLDQLSRLQDATRSSSAARGLSGAWTGNIKLEVPETGVSLGEISRLLKERFGNDVHIDGDLVETPTGGLALTVRGNGVPARTFSSSATELEKLTVEAAEYVYSKSQPARWAAFLTNSGRNEEAIAFCRTAIPSVDAPIRAELLNDWANALENTGGSAREALALYREAARLDPGLWRSYANIMNTFMLLGEEEEAWHAGQDMRKAAGGRPGRSPEQNYQNWDLLTWNLGPWLTSSEADAEANAGLGTQLATAGTVIADIEARLHDRRPPTWRFRQRRMIPAIRPSRRWPISYAAAWRPKPTTPSGPWRRWKRLALPMPIRSCPQTFRVTTAGSRRPKQRPDIRTKPTPCSTRPARSWTATASAPTSSTIAAMGRARKKRTLKRWHSPQTFQLRTTPGASRSRATAT